MLRLMLFACFLCWTVEANIAYADNCASKVSSPAAAASQPAYSAARMWLQWLGRPYTFTCKTLNTPAPARVRCSHGSEYYDTVPWGCVGSNCGADHYDQWGWRNGSSWVLSGGTGEAWQFTFDGWLHGYVTYQCGPDPSNPFGPFICWYGTCLQ